MEVAGFGLHWSALGMDSVFKEGSTRDPQRTGTRWPSGARVESGTGHEVRHGDIEESGSRT